MSYRRSILIATALAVGVAAVAVGHEEHSRAEQAMNYRHSLFQAIAWNMAPIGAMAQGKAPFSQSEAATRAARVAALAEMLPEAFPAGSAIKGKSEAKAAIWAQPAEFDAVLQKFIKQSKALADGAKGADLDKLKGLANDTRAVCKECHEKFKED